MCPSCFIPSLLRAFWWLNSGICSQALLFPNGSFLFRSYCCPLLDCSCWWADPGVGALAVAQKERLSLTFKSFLEVQDNTWTAQEKVQPQLFALSRWLCGVGCVSLLAKAKMQISLFFSFNNFWCSLLLLTLNLILPTSLLFDLMWGFFVIKNIWFIALQIFPSITIAVFHYVLDFFF